LIEFEDDDTGKPVCCRKCEGKFIAPGVLDLAKFAPHFYQDPKGILHGLAVAGVLGLVMALFFLGVFNPAVGPDNTYNIGLLNTRQNGVIVGSALFVAGVVGAAIERNRGR
jgi:hypothetical protein